MGKTTVRGLGLFAALAALTVATGPGLVAQDAKKKKDEPKTSASKGTIKVGEGKDGKWRFSIYDADGVFLGASAPRGFESKADAVKGIELLKAALVGAKVEDKPKGDDDDKDPPKKEKEKDKGKPKEKAKDKDAK